MKKYEAEMWSVFWSNFLHWVIGTLKKKYGVELQVNLRSKGKIKYLYLADLEVPKSKRNKGTGTEVMRSLCAFADLWGLPISIVAWHKDSDTEGLIRFYRRFGFVDNLDKRKIPGTFIRPAKINRRRRR